MFACCLKFGSLKPRT